MKAKNPKYTSTTTVLPIREMADKLKNDDTLLQKDSLHTVLSNSHDYHLDNLSNHKIGLIFKHVPQTIE